MSHSTGGYGPRPEEDWRPPVDAGGSQSGWQTNSPDEVAARQAYHRYIRGYRESSQGYGGSNPGYGPPGVSGYGYGSYRNPAYGPTGHGTPAGPRPIPRRWAPPPEPRDGGGFGGAFLCLIIIAVVLTGTIGLGKGMVALNLGGSQPSVSSSEPGAEPVSARSVRNLTNEDALSLQRTVGPALVDVTAALTSQHAVGSGTGIVLSSNGEILTNNHVIRGASSVKVTDIGNGRTYPATVVGYDVEHDIAILQARGASGLRTARLGDSDTVQVGDQVAAIGNAGGVGGKPSVDTGPVTELNRSIKTSDELSGRTERLTGLIEAQANIRPGDSGGPLVNASGQVIGVDVAASVDSHSDQPDGTGYAIPINDALSVVSQIRGGNSTEAVHVGQAGLLGVVLNGSSDRGIRDMMAELGGSPSANPTSVEGAYVADVGASSPADRAGLESGDVITTVDGRPIDSAGTLATLVSMHRPGDRLVVTWLKPSGQQLTKTLALAPAPPS